MREYLHRLAAEHDCRGSTAPVRGHQDQLACMCRGGVDDRLVNMLPFDMNRLTANAGRVGRIRDGGEGLLGVSVGLLLIFASRAFELGATGEYREGLGDSHCGNFGADLSRKSDAVLNSFGGEVLTGRSGSGYSCTPVLSRRRFCFPRSSARSI